MSQVNEHTKREQLHTSRSPQADHPRRLKRMKYLKSLDSIPPLQQCQPIWREHPVGWIVVEVVVGKQGSSEYEKKKGVAKVRHH